MQKSIFLETKRTYCRQLTIDDANDFFNLNQDLEVLKFTGDSPFENIEDAKKFLEKYDQYEKYGVGRLAVIHKKSNHFLGWCGLKYSQDKNEFDIGFRFHKKYWNQGFATETAKKCLEFGFNKIEINKIVGRAMQENSASINVLKKIGMNFKENFNFGGNNGIIYEISKETFIQ